MFSQRRFSYYSIFNPFNINLLWIKKKKWFVFNLLPYLLLFVSFKRLWPTCPDTLPFKHYFLSFSSSFSLSFQRPHLFNSFHLHKLLACLNVKRQVKLIHLKTKQNNINCQGPITFFQTLFISFDHYHFIVVIQGEIWWDRKEDQERKRCFNLITNGKKTFFFRELEHNHTLCCM